jgi:hypothetical protein
MRKAFNFYKSYADIYFELPSLEEKEAFMSALLKKQFCNIEPENLPPMAKFAYMTQAHAINSQVDGYIHKGGEFEVIAKDDTPPCQGGTEGGGAGGRQGGYEGACQPPSVQEEEKEKEKGEEEGHVCDEKIKQMLSPKKTKTRNVKIFTPPTLEDVELFFHDNGYAREIAIKCFNHYNFANWHDSRGNPVKNWKQKISNNWFKEEYKTTALPNASYDSQGSTNGAGAKKPSYYVNVKVDGGGFERKPRHQVRTTDVVLCDG